MNAVGVHLIVDLKECRADLLDDLSFIRETLLEAARSNGATIVGQTFHKFAPQGVTGVVAIAESHLCIHTWPEYRFAAVDIFSCGTSFDANNAARFIIAQLEATTAPVTELQRGALSELADVVG